MLAVGDIPFAVGAITPAGWLARSWAVVALVARIGVAAWQKWIWESLWAAPFRDKSASEIAEAPAWTLVVSLLILVRNRRVAAA